jgi:MSHA biogenesis protein MshQ
VQIYIGSEVSGDDDLSFNTAGAVADFQVFLYPGADWKVDKDASFVGLIYAPGTSSTIEFDDDSRIRGALVTAGETKLGKDAELYYSAADQAAVGGVSTCVASTAPGSFNVFETSTGAGAIAGVIKTKIAGSAFGLDMVAISSGAQANSFTNSVKVELLGNTSTGVALDANNCPISSTVLQTATAAINNGRSTVGLAAVSDAWKNVRARVSYPTTSPSVTSCSTDNFAIRPASFGGVTVSDASSATAGTARTLTNTAASGGNVHKAGQPFQIVATARNAAGATTSNYAGSPAASLTACVLPATGCTLGALAAGTWSAASGTVTTTGASYSEVGAFTMKLVDASFAAVDAADGSSAAEMTIESAVLNVGRFVPDHFDLATASTPVFKTFNDTTCGTRTFTYVGQPFGYVTLPEAAITAKNAAGAATVNYAGALWKLAPAGVAQDYTHAPVTYPLDPGLVGTPVLTETGSGSGTLVANAADAIAFARSIPIAPFNADITLTMSIEDAAENGVPGNGIIMTATPAVFSSMAFDAGNEIRFGQLVLSNAHGSELLALPVPIETRYWTGAGFVLNAADHCTQLAATHVVLSNWQRNLDPCETSVTLSGRFNAGRGNLRFSAPVPAPAPGNTGSVDLTLQLDVVAAGSTCVGGAVTATAAASQSWLQGHWSGTPVQYNQNPSARASFGLHRGSRPLIYLREIW